jgi:hypothetical protein
MTNNPQDKRMVKKELESILQNLLSSNDPKESEEFEN